MGITLRGLRSLEEPASLVDVTLDSGRISAIQPTQLGPEAEQGQFPLAFPGFINAHSHLPMSLLRGLADDVPLKTWLEDHVWPAESRLQPEDVYWGSLLAIAEGLRSGTTTFIDMYFHCDEIARAVEESGVRALLSYGMIAPSLKDRGREEIDRSVALVKRWNKRADGRIQIALSPHTLYTCGEDVWREAIEQAQSLGVPIHTHVAETRPEVEDWVRKTGQSPVRYLQELGAFAVPMLSAHCVHVNDEDIAILSEHPVTVAHCPKSNAKLGSGIAPVTKMRKAGVCVALGTDGAASNNRLDMFEELRAAWILQRAKEEDAALLSSSEVLAMAVDAGRDIVGLPNVGLSVGAPADLVVLATDRLHSTPSHDPAAMLAYASSSQDVTDVYVDGKALLKGGELRTIDEERVRWEVEHRVHRIANR